MPFSSEVDLLARAPHNFRFRMQRLNITKSKIITLSNKSSITVKELCYIDNFSSDTLAFNTQAKKIYVKLILFTTVTKGWLAAIIRVILKPHSAHDDRLKQWNEREDGDMTSEAGWSDVMLNDPNDQIGDYIEKSPESLEYPVE